MSSFSKKIFKGIFVILNLGFASAYGAEAKPASSSMGELSVAIHHPSDVSIDALYRQHGNPCMLYIPQEELSALGNDIHKLKALFENYRIKTGSDSSFFEKNTLWNEKDWQETFDTLTGYARSHKKPFMFHPSELSQLLEDAKSILRSFVSPDTIDPTKMKKDFIEKIGINRLFTYTKLQKVIHDKNLSHIHLPKKILVIKDNETGTYLTGEAASKLLDHMMLTIINNYEAQIKIHYLLFDQARYDFRIFAEKYPLSRTPFSRETLHELVQLVKEAPFDVGYDNIFSDANGDAVIIDTEDKGERAKSSLPKLIMRYAPSHLKDELIAKAGL